MRAAGEGLLLYKNGPVCDDNFSENSADAICRHLGYSGYSSWSSGSKWDIQNNYSINMSDVQCSSGDWSSCTYTTNNSCEHSEDIFLACAGTFFTITRIANPIFHFPMSASAKFYVSVLYHSP